MKKVYIHIGTHKTGTSSVQQILSNNLKYFSKLGFEIYSDVYDANLEFCIGQIDKSPKNAILSYEGLSGNMHSGFSGASEKILLLEKLSKNSDMTVIVCYREQVGFITSCYSQYIHEGGTKTITEYLDGFNLEGLKYAEHTRMIGNILPNSRLSVFKYGRDTVLKDFFSVIGVNLEELTLDRLSQAKNKSYSPEALNFAVRVNGSLTPKERVWLRTYLQRNEIKATSDRRTTLSLEQFESLKKYYAEDNLAFCEKYDLERFVQGGYEYFPPSNSLSDIKILTKMVVSQEVNGNSAVVNSIVKLEMMIGKLLLKIRTYIKG